MLNRFKVNPLGIVVGIVIGVIATLLLINVIPHSVTPYVVEGYSNGTNYDGSAIGVSKEIGGPGEGYIIAGARWREFGGPWHDNGTPDSLKPPETGQKIRLGIVYVRSTTSGIGTPVVAWYEVLSQ